MAGLRNRRRTGGRALATVLALLLATCPALAERCYALNGDGFAALVNGDGMVRIEPGRYASILTLVEGRLYAAKREGDAAQCYALINASGEALTDFAIEACAAVGEAVLVRSAGYWGALDVNGDTLLPLDYTQLASADGETFLGTRSDACDDEPDALYRVTSDGMAEETGVALAAPMETFSDGLMLYLDAETGLYGYLDAAGSIVIQPEYVSARAFQSGYAVAASEEGLGMIDREGTWIVDPYYLWLEQAGDMAVGAADDGFADVYPLNDLSTWSPISYDARASIAGNAVVLWDGFSTSVYRKDGTLVWRAIGQVSVSAGCEDQLVLSFGDYGASTVSLLSLNGVVSSQPYQWMTPLNDRMYAVIQCDAQAYHSESIDDDQVTVDYGSFRYGLMNAALEIVAPCEALGVQIVGDDAFLLQTEDGWTLLNEEGRTLWQYTP